jgi:hypothetical protein
MGWSEKSGGPTPLAEFKTPPPATTATNTTTTIAVTDAPTTTTTAAVDDGGTQQRADDDCHGRKKRLRGGLEMDAIIGKDGGGGGAIGEDQDRDDGEPRPFVLLPMYGEHKRAVSSLSFAPTSASSLSFGGNSWNSNDGSRSTRVLCASASADGSAKVWETPTQHDTDDSDDKATKIAADVDGGGGGVGGGGGGTDASKKEKSGKGPSSSSSSLSSFIIGSGRTTTSSSRLDPKLSLVGHSRGINGKRAERERRWRWGWVGASFDCFFVLSPLSSYRGRYLFFDTCFVLLSSIPSPSFFSFVRL